MKVLVVDDEYEYCEMFKKVLGKRGHSVICASNGQQGLDVYYAAITETPKVSAEKHQHKLESKKIKSPRSLSPPFDLVILNYNMPIMKGIKVAGEILNLFPTQTLFFVSGTHREILKVRMMHELGYILDIVQKPVLEKDVIGLMENYYLAN